MQSAMHLKTPILPGGKIELNNLTVPVGEWVDVFVVFPNFSTTTQRRSALDILADCDGCGSQWDNKQTAPVGSFALNQFGLYDTVGNVWEWTCSGYENKYDDKEKGCIHKKSDSPRVIRGGAWINVPGNVRVSNRYRYSHDSRYSVVGFRVARLTL